MDRAPLATEPATERAATGISGLDEVLAGGFVVDRLYLIEGVPGSGKTTLALQFLLEGVRRGEKVLYVTLSETGEELQSVTSSHGWSLDGVTVRELAPSEDSLRPDEQYTMFHPSEVELSETTRAILSDVEQLKPTRVVFDSLSELRLMAGNPLRYRRQILALKQFFAGRRCTVLLLDDMTSAQQDLQVQSIAHGVVRLEQLFPEIGAERRRLLVVKYRGVKFYGGYHDFAIHRGGLQVFPRIIARNAPRKNTGERIPGGVAGLDGLLGGGIERGTSTLIVGSPGTGKSTLAAQIVSQAALRGEAAAMFIFDESRSTLLTRTRAVGIDLGPHLESGRLTIRQVDPAELSPGELAHIIRSEVEERSAAVVVLDSLNGYLNAMPEERFVIIHLHELLSYLGQADVATLIIGAHQGMIGTAMQTPVDASYLADAVILMRYFEAGGEVRQAISVVKKRGGSHERTIREFAIRSNGLFIGEPLREFRGVLTGVPVLVGKNGRPLEEERMSENERRSMELRLLILAPTLRDATLTSGVLVREGIRCLICPDLETLCEKIEGGAGAIFLPEEAIGPDRPDCLLAALARQPAWSDLPILVLSRHGADSAAVAQAMDLLGNVTVVERPTRMAALVSAVRSALRARQRQYQIREHLAERAHSEEALREADRRKDEFLAILAHELRNPLAPIRNSLHILRATGGEDAGVQGIAEMMERQVNQMVRLVDDLLEVSRITRGKIELRKEAVDLGTLIRGAVEIGRPLIDAAGHVLVVHVPEQPVVIEADPVRIAQVLANLLNNAAKYTDHGGTIEIGGRREGEEAILEVRDSGRGIPPDMLPRVFDLFTQLDGSMDRAQGGLGIGLTLARTLVELHGGRMEAHSEGPGSGSRFVVRLPLPTAIPDLRPKETEASPVSSVALRKILVVDDNRDAADSLAMVLGLLSAQVQVAYNGREALAAIEQWRPSVVFLDIGMAGIDGHEVARRIRLDRAFDDVVLIALTGWGQERDRRNSREAGINHHLTKPVDIAALQTLLASLAPAAPDHSTLA